MLTNYKSCSIFICILLAATMSVSKVWKIDRVRCSSELCSNFFCHIVRNSSRLQLLDAGCTLKRPTHSVLVQSRLLYRYFTTYRTFLYDTTNDLCDFLGDRKKFQPMLEVFGSYIEKYSNINHTCPLVGNVTVSGMQYDSGMMKNTIIPSGQYKVDMRMYEIETNKTIFYSETFVTV